MPAPRTVMSILANPPSSLHHSSGPGRGVGRRMPNDQRKALEWKDGVPVSVRFDDPFYSLENGWSETRHTFLAGNDLPERFATGFHIAELGFGTGLNAVAALHLWRESGQAGSLRFTSFELEPMGAEDMDRALSRWPELHALAEPIIRARDQGSLQVETPDLNLTVVPGDARETVPAWVGQADAWFLDGFAPTKNPALWEPALLMEVARHTRSGGTAATYSAAGHVRTALSEAGFEVERRQGFGRKRHMTVARLR